MIRYHVVSMVLLEAVRYCVATSSTAGINISTFAFLSGRLQHSSLSRRTGQDSRHHRRAWQVFRRSQRPSAKGDRTVASIGDPFRQGASHPKDAVLHLALGSIPTLLVDKASAAVEVASSTASEMGPRLDVSAAVSFGAIAASFFFLQVR